MFGLVVSEGGVVTCEGAAPLMIPPSYADPIESFAESLSKEFPDMDERTWIGLEDEILDLYWDIDESLRAPPRLSNTSGEEFAPQVLFFELSDPRAVTAGLSALARDPELIDEVTAAAHASDFSEPVKFPWLSDNPVGKTASRTVLGHITISATELRIEVNSSDRAAQVTKEVEARVGLLVRYQCTRHDTFDISSASRDQSDLGEGIESPQVRAALAEIAAARKSEWFDQPIPLLNNLTPREAAKTEEGRGRLERLIEVYSFSAGGRDPNGLASMLNPTEDEIRAELGL